MNRSLPARVLLSTAFLLAACAVFAIPTDITYSEGDASIRFKTGKQQEAQIGAVVNTGDMLKTGRDGLVELDQKGVTLKISPNTVFTLMERERKGSTTPVLSVALGSIKFRYDKLTGKEPTVQTNGCAMGVRGTEFSVFAGADGSTLVVVDSGSVEVEAEGKTVALAPDEGVEVKLGQGPGEKFAVHRDQIDYSKWNDEKLAGMLADPATAMTGIEARMASYIASVTEYDGLYRASRQRLDEERKKKAAILEQKGKEEAQKLEEEIISPLAFKTGYLFLNVRYFSLAALSLRRYVGGRMYMFMKSRYITTPADPAWTEFRGRFDGLLESFERSVVPQLTAEDI
ncbi:MAG: FecR domain-containing protein [Spirochaetes bacterium]|nr:FecR domain-containing protein [Spirochaetota bacterium]